jgi:hypothetical protein
VEYYIDRGKPKNSEKNLSQCPSYTTNPTLIDPGANSSLRGESLATIDPSHGTAISALYWRDLVKLQKTSVSIASGRIFEARTSRIQSRRVNLSTTTIDVKEFFEHGNEHSGSIKVRGFLD